MTLIYNKLPSKDKRRELRRNQTDAEKVLWHHLRSKGLLGLKFYRQYGIGGYVVDFFCPECKLAVELDGGQHLVKDNREYDNARTLYLKSIGIDVIRFWNNDVLKNTEGVLERLSDVLKNRL